jgi:hypothetical protein
VLIDGDPTQDISASRNIVAISKEGVETLRDKFD